jgi:hypothetical protein
MIHSGQDESNENRSELLDQFNLFAIEPKRERS